MNLTERHLKIILLIFLGFLTAGFLLWFNRSFTVTRDFFAMGTAFEITATGKNPNRAIDAAFQEIKRIESLTGYDEKSDLQKVNHMAGITSVTVSSETLDILRLVDAHFQTLSGAFDPTVAPLIDLWGFGTDSTPRLPGQDTIKKTTLLVDFRNVQINYRAKTVFLPHTGMKLDLGGIAKGYAIDRAYHILDQKGITSALINGGSSSIRVIGAKTVATPWKLGIGHPRRSGDLLGTLRLPNDRALGTSADTQNFFIKDGTRYSHLLDPHTGYPSRGKMLVTVTAPTAVEADLLSTAFFILPAEQITAYTKSHPEIGVITVDSKGRLTVFNESRFLKI